MTTKDCWERNCERIRKDPDRHLTQIAVLLDRALTLTQEVNDLATGLHDAGVLPSKTLQAVYRRQDDIASRLFALEGVINEAAKRPTWKRRAAQQRANVLALGRRNRLRARAAKRRRAKK